jgi:hypothetical protein
VPILRIVIGLRNNGRRLLNHFVRAQYDPLLADFAAGETLAQFNAESYATVPEAIAGRSGKRD